MKKLKIVNKVKFYSVVGFIGLFFIGLAAYAYVDYQTHMPVSFKGEDQVFEIEPGQGLSQIALDLEEQGLIRGDYWFMFYVAYKGWAGQLQAGQYLLNPRMGIPEIARKIVKGEVSPDEVKTSIPEGFTLKQIDKRLAELELIKAGELAERKELEGYLFPDTYTFKKGTELKEIIAQMMGNFDLRIGDELTAEIQRQGKTLDEIVTMASILEKEVRSYYEKRVAAGIFWKRIKSSYPLQSCATLAYILGENKRVYSIEDTKIDSPYNTYQHAGLPPGPICNPGLESIKAAIYPIQTDYNYFLSDANGNTIFSRTAEEHQANKEKYLR